jgi:hypothetical protein
VSSKGKAYVSKLVVGSFVIFGFELDKNVYVFGGTTYTPTTFNDMWRFDLNEHRWCRCLARGQYPTPKALSSSVIYKDCLVLFGGWAHPPPYPIMQVSGDREV